MSELSCLSISDFCSAQRYIAEARRYPMDNDGRRHHGFIYTLEGTETYKFREGSVKALPHTLLYIPKGRTYTISLEGSVSDAVALDFEICAECHSEPFIIPLEENNPIQPLVMKAVSEWHGNKTACKAMCLSTLYNIIATAARLEEKFIHPRKYEKIRIAVEYLHDHYTEQDFRIESLSGMCGINSAYFARLFADKYGLSPKEYVLELKMRKARELLSVGKYSVSEIGALLGYSDVYHFSKSFKKGTGMSPVEWRGKSK